MSILGRIFIIALFSLYVSPVFAIGNLTITGYDMAPQYVNTRQEYNMLNLSLNATNGNVSITYINITIGGTASIANISSVQIINSSGAVIVSNSTNSSSTNFTLYLPAVFNVTSAIGNVTIIVSVNISSSATRFYNFTLNVTNLSVVTQGLGLGDNISVVYAGATANSVRSNESQIHDLHANASITPRFVDTNVMNQSFVYIVTPTGGDYLKNISITIPSQYTIVQLTSVRRGTTTLTGVTDYTNTTSEGRINVSLASSTSETLMINFTLNTNNTAVSGLAFNSTLTMNNLSSIAVDVNVTNTTVATQQLINVTKFTILKGAAVVNDTDYWEFNLTLNFTANTSGLIQFRMNNWTCTEGYNISLMNQTDVRGARFYTSLRSDYTNISTVNQFNVTNVYNLTQGITYNATSTSILNVFLRMVIPTGTQISSSWWTTYYILFRSTP